MKIRKKALQTIKENTRLKSLLALQFEKSIYTIERWIDLNDDNLTKAAALEIIKQETKLSDSDLLEREVA